MTGPRSYWRMAVGAAVFLSLLYGFQVWGAADDEAHLSFGLAVARQSANWAAWLIMTPAVIWLARRFPLETWPRPGWFWIQIVLGLFFALVAGALAGIIRSLLGVAEAPTLVDAVVASMALAFARNFVTFVAIATTYHAVTYHLRVRDREQATARLELDLSRAKIASLEGRLQPHFLFNTLNAITALIRDDPRTAEVMVGKLSDLLRATLKADPSSTVPLDEELAIVEQYLALERLRFQDRLRVSITADAAARAAAVPPLILQPVVENAIKHGMSSVEGAVTVAVAATISNGWLRIVVEDDGIGYGNAPARSAGTGLGLVTLNARLKHAYPSTHRFTIEPLAVPGRTGTRATIEIPVVS